jgi:hypothetical protein
VALPLVAAATGGEEFTGEILSAGVDEKTDNEIAFSQMTRVGSALKTDVGHSSASWVVDDPAAQKFMITGGDGQVRELYQIPSNLNEKPGIFEWIVDRSGDEPVITHRRFITGGTITGSPNQRP